MTHPSSDVLDPQGEALVIELRRLQRALAAEGREDDWLPARARSAAPARRERRSPTGLGRYFQIIGNALARKAAQAPQARADPKQAPPMRLVERVDPPEPETLSISPPDAAPTALTEAIAPAIPLNSDRLRELRSRAITMATHGVDFILARGVHAAAAPAGNADWSEHLNHAFQGQLRTASRVMLVAGTVGLGWGAFVPLSGAVILPGRLVVESQVKDIQHPTGGVVISIPAHDGEHVKAGDVLLRLDRTQIEANYQMYATQFREVEMRVARLVAERDGETIRIPEDLAIDKTPGAARIVAAEQALFGARKKALSSQKDLLQNNVEQYDKQLAGLQAQIEAKASQAALIENELGGVQQLFDKGLVPLTRLSTLKREKATLQGDGGQLEASVAETKTKIAQAMLQSLRIEQDFRAEVTKDLADAQARMSEVGEKVVAVRDQLDHLEVRAPTDGIVHELSMHTIGGVIRPSDVVMKIVPDMDQLELEGRLMPKDIDQVHAGQTAMVRFPALNHQTTPELAGKVTYVSPDVTNDAKSNASYYTVRVSIPDSQRSRLGGTALTSGMPVEALLQLRNRTMLSYLAKPLLDQFHRMFKES